MHGTWTVREIMDRRTSQKDATLAEKVRAVPAKGHLAPSHCSWRSPKTRFGNMTRQCSFLCANYTPRYRYCPRDCGVGYASLKHCLLARLKIDQNSFWVICTSPTDAAIVRATLHLGRKLGLAMIDQGAETKSSAQGLRKRDAKRRKNCCSGDR